MRSISALFWCLLLAVSAAGCFVPELPDDTVFSCDTTADCADQGEVCVARAGLRGYCCKATTEVCNGRDDDCDGQKDELTDTSCYGGLAGTEGKGLCKAGTPTCGSNGEIVCAGEIRPTTESCNGKDDDCDGQTDEGFDLQTDIINCGQCGTVCDVETQVCRGGFCRARGELDCGDNVDNDGDIAADCADNDCASQVCGPGCRCIGGQRGEDLCNDGVSNDGDPATDCVDPDCNGKECGTGGCSCFAGRKTESNCNDGVDNDGDSLTDCADYDCAYKDLGNGTRCQGGKRVESDCGDDADNDGDGARNCADTDCAGVRTAGTGVICSVSTPGALDEAHCADGVDNDGDKGTDCRTTGQGGDSNCTSGTGSCGFGCRIISCNPSPASFVKKEAVCDDDFDNDGDGGKDCADADCYGSPGNVCRKADGTQGTCQSNRTCG